MLEQYCLSINLVGLEQTLLGLQQTTAVEHLYIFTLGEQLLVIRFEVLQHIEVHFVEVSFFHLLVNCLVLIGVDKTIGDWVQVGPLFLLYLVQLLILLNNVTLACQRDGLFLYW